MELLKNYISINYEKYIHLVSHRLNKDHLYRTFRDDTWLINDFISDNIDSYKKLLA
ncbi:MAG: hypothetical protein P1U46_02630 [Patescibacteria group bacterium]|nr:hypothetical protein [Patescibacteria group bacterium]